MPCARRDHATVLLDTSQHPRLFMTGGIDRDWRSLGDAWILDLEKTDGKIKRGSWLNCKVNTYNHVAKQCTNWHATMSDSKIKMYTALNFLHQYFAYKDYFQ